jgi:small subunit ribosomal protein S18
MPKPMRKKPAGAEKKLKKKTSILTTEKVVWVDYKDANLLRRFMSDRAKIRARRVTGNDQQQQAAVAKAIKLSREMALLPYSVRQVQQRTKGRGRDRRDSERDSELAPDAENPLPTGDQLEAADGVEAAEGTEAGNGAETTETTEVSESDDTGAGEELADVSPGGDAE